MLIAVLESARGSIERDVEFSRGMFTTEGLGEISIDDLRRLDAANQLAWTSDDMRILALGYSPTPASHSSRTSASPTPSSSSRSRPRSSTSRRTASARRRRPNSGASSAT